MKVKKVNLIITTYNSSKEPEIKTKYSYSFEYDNDTVYINLGEINKNAR